MTESIYDFSLFYMFDLLEIVKMQINNISILVNNDFASNKEKTIKIAKLIIKNFKHLIPI